MRGRALLRSGILIVFSFRLGYRYCYADSLGSYNLYPSAVIGSSRYVGLGGATVASPDGYAANFINPAGLGGLCGSGIDFGSDSNQIDNFVVDLSNPKSKALNDPIRFSFSGFRFTSDDGWGFGFAMQTPTRIDDIFNGNVIKNKKNLQFLPSGDQTEIQVNNNTYTLGVGKRIGERAAIGLALNYIQISESYDFTPLQNTTAPIHQVATGDTFSADLGVVARPWTWLQVGAVYKMGYQAAFDPTRNPPTPIFPTIKPFRDGKSPDRVTAGLAWMPHKKFTLFAQSTYVRKMKDSVVVGSGVFPGGSNIVAYGQRDAIDGNWGMELVPIDEPDLTFKLWAGGYLEDTGIQGGYSRYHRTAGFGFSPWFLSLNMAIDDTELYNNFSVGLGVDLLQVATRVAQFYGWKLPL